MKFFIGYLLFVWFVTISLQAYVLGHLPATLDERLQIVELCFFMPFIFLFFLKIYFDIDEYFEDEK